MRKWMAVGALALAVAAADVPAAQAQDTFVDENGDGIDDGAAHRHRFGRRGALRGVRSQLTEEQRAELKTALEALKASEATRDEVRAAVDELLAGYGFERPDAADRLTQRLSGVLTETQLAEVQAAIGELKAAEASRSEVKAAVDALLEGYGVERPERSGRLSSVLTEDQRSSLRAEIDALREGGATRDEVRAAFEAKLTEFGLDPSSIRSPRSGGPGRFGKFRGRRGGFRGPAPAPADDAATSDAN